MKRNLLLSCFVCLLMPSCILYSLNPLSKKNETTPEGLEGTWADKHTEYTITLSEDKSTYEVTEKKLDEKESGQTCTRLMTLSKVGDTLYASLFFKDCNPKLRDDFAFFPLMPAWNIVMLKLDGDQLSFRSFDPDSIKKDGIKEPGYVALHAPDGDSCHIYGSDPAELREWLSKNGEKLFSIKRDPLKRKPPASEPAKD